MTILIFLKELRERDVVLCYCGLINIFLFLFAMLFYFMDETQVMGINAWIKPMKFGLSLTIYTWTFGWIMYYLPKWKKLIKVLSFIIAISMLIEILVIFYQASRGVRSHFNIATTFDQSMFSLMGSMIAINTVVVVLVSILFFIQKPKVDFNYLMSVRFALIIFIIANIIGGIMIGNHAHSIGGLDGGDGLPFVNWSVIHGDLRIGHFFGLHSIQIIPITAWLSKSKFSNSKQHLIFIIAISSIYLLLLGYLYYNASQGNPLF